MLILYLFFAMMHSPAEQQLLSCVYKHYGDFIDDSVTSLHTSHTHLL